MDNTPFLGQRHYTIPDVIIWPSWSEEDTLVLVNMNVVLSKINQGEEVIDFLDALASLDFKLSVSE